MAEIERLKGEFPKYETLNIMAQQLSALVSWELHGGHDMEKIGAMRLGVIISKFIEDIDPDAASKLYPAAAEVERILAGK